MPYLIDAALFKQAARLVLTPPAPPRRRRRGALQWLPKSDRQCSCGRSSNLHCNCEASVSPCLRVEILLSDQR